MRSLAYSDPRGYGTPVLFVHGFSHNRVVWERLMRDLPDGLRPISVDLRGHGESPWDPGAAYGLSDYAMDLPELLDSLAIERAIVVGHSLGGNVSTLFAAAAPTRVHALVLVDTGPALEARGTEHVVDEVDRILRSYASIDEFLAQLALIHPNGDPETLRRLAETGVVRRVDSRFEPSFDPGVLVGASGSLEDPEGQLYCDEMAAIEQRLWSALRTLRCPVLVVRGGLSAVFSKKVANEMVDEVLSDGRLVTLPKAGHAIMIDDAVGLSVSIRAFLSRVPPL